MKKIMIIDESNFSQVCSAILEIEGYKTEILKDVEGLLSRLNDEFGLIITSYPFVHFLFEEIKKEIKKMNLPLIILVDHINRDLISLLKSFNNSYCMVKPLDYQRFRSLVKAIVSCNTSPAGEYNIL
jgi:DNA-binding NtrC family response regulator